MSENQLQLDGVNIILGVTGGIAAYKALELVRNLTAQGASVRVVMTHGAQAFVTPISFQALSGKPVHTTLLDADAEAAMGHIELARWADLVVIAPASANTLARIAHGLADDLLSTTVLATAAPVLIAPAMNQRMWAHSAVQRNVRQLTEDGHIVLEPMSGSQACGDIGPGRMQEPADIFTAVVQHKTGLPQLNNRWLITAGPTYEDIDPVRFVGNRSSGKMGYAIAHAAALAGASVELVSGPTAIEAPPGVRFHSVRSAAQMDKVVTKLVDQCDVFVAAAAVADYGLVPAEHKIKKQSQEWTLTLHPNPDILQKVLEMNLPITSVGFAAETENLIPHAQAKLKRKPVDLLCANQVGQPKGGFESVDNALMLLYKDGRQESLAFQSKNTLAAHLVQRIAVCKEGDQS